MTTDIESTWGHLFEDEYFPTNPDLSNLFYLFFRIYLLKFYKV